MTSVNLFILETDEYVTHTEQRVSHRPSHVVTINLPVAHQSNGSE